MSVTLTEKAFNLVRAIEANKDPSATVWAVANHTSINGANWLTDPTDPAVEEQNASTSLKENGLMETGNIANVYKDDNGTLPESLAELIEFCTRIARLEQATIVPALKASDYESFSTVPDPKYPEAFAKFHKGLKTLKERLDSTIKVSADNLVNTVASYVQAQYDSMATNLPVNVTEAEVQTIAAGIAEKFAEDFAAKIQEKLSELTNVSGSA